jgi:hypothetical protein
VLPIRFSIAALLSTVAWAQAGGVSFEKNAYAVLEKAGCRSCHNSDGVAAGTRLLFPEGDTQPARIAAFGNSLVTLVDRLAPASIRFRFTHRLYDDTSRDKFGDDICPADALLRIQAEGLHA